MAKQTTKSKHILVLPDIHVPHHDKRAIAKALEYARAHAWDYVIQLGDFMDLEAPSRHAIGLPRVTEGQRIVDEFAIGNRLLRDITKAATAKNKKAKLVMTLGNHENRLNKFVDKFPWLEGILDFAQLLGTTELGWEVVPYGKLYRIGPLNFFHGIYHGLNPTKKHAEAFGVNIVHGHTHDVAQCSIRRHGIGKAIHAFSIGCLANYRQKYLGGSPTNWQHAIAHFEVMGPKFNVKNLFL